MKKVSFSRNAMLKESFSAPTTSMLVHPSDAPSTPRIGNDVRVERIRAAKLSSRDGDSAAHGRRRHHRRAGRNTRRRTWPRSSCCCCGATPHTRGARPAGLGTDTAAAGVCAHAVPVACAGARADNARRALVAAAVHLLVVLGRNAGGGCRRRRRRRRHLPRRRPAARGVLGHVLRHCAAFVHCLRPVAPYYSRRPPGGSIWGGERMLAPVIIGGINSLVVVTVAAQRYRPPALRR